MEYVNLGASGAWHYDLQPAGRRRADRQVQAGPAGADLALDPALIKRLSDASRWAR
jgi:hypothetical protein